MLFDDRGRPEDFVYLEVNGAFGKMTGMEDVTGRKITEVIPGFKDSNPELFEIYGRVAQTGRPEKFETEIKPLGIWLSISVYSPERGCFVAVFDNITEDKQAEVELRASEKLYRAIGESIDYGVWVCAPDGRNIYASESFLKLAGITQEQCSNFGWVDILHPDDAGNTIAAWKECVRSEGVWDNEQRFRGTDGLWHPILARWVPVRNERGELIYWAGINLDISRMKQAENELRASEERFRALTTASSDVVYSMSPDWSEMRQLIGQNFLADTVKPNRNWLQEYIHPDDQLHVMSVINEAIRTKSVFELEHRVLRVDGTPGWTFSRAIPLLDTNGTIVEWFGAASDVTARRRAEDELSANLVRLKT
jgi:PAS domain S-box-containing protein